MSLTKKELRQKVVSFRKNLTYIECVTKSRIIINKILESKWYLEADTIISYVSVNNEVYTKEFIVQAIKDNKKVAVPKIIDNKMEFYYINSLDELKEGYFNIPEPVNISKICIPIPDKTLMIVPGVAFDKENNRLGYGGGFYDKYLSVHNVYKMGICFKEQLFDSICTEKYDIKMDEVITD